MAFPEDSIERFILNAIKVHTFINGDEFTDVETDGGLVPSISKKLKMIEDDIAGSVGPIIEMIEEAGSLALAGSVRYNEAQVLTPSEILQARENIAIDIPNMPPMSPAAVFDFTLGFADDRLADTRTDVAYSYNDEGVAIAHSAGVPRIDHNPLTGETIGYISELAVDYLPIRSETFAGWGTLDIGGGFGSPCLAPNGRLEAIDWTWPSSTSADSFGSYTVSGDASNQTSLCIWLRKKTGGDTLRLSLSDLTTTDNSPLITVDTTWRLFYFSSSLLSNTGSISLGFNSGGGSSVVPGDEFEIWHPALALGIHPNLSYRPTVDTPQSQTASGVIMDLVEEDTVINTSEFTIIALVDTTNFDSTRQSVIFNISDSAGDESIFMDMSGSQFRGSLINTTEGITISQDLGPVNTGVRAIGISTSLDGVIALVNGDDATVWNGSTGITPSGLTQFVIGKHATLSAKEAGIPIKRVILYRRACTQLQLAALLSYWNRG